MMLSSSATTVDELASAQVAADWITVVASCLTVREGGEEAVGRKEDYSAPLYMYNRDKAS